MEWFDPILLSRIQFAFVVSFHIIFPSFTIGLASWLVVLEVLHLKTKRVVYREIYEQWVKIFAMTFGMGVVSGVVMAYQFGTNWSVFSYKVGNVIGPLLAFEVLTAFFLEASFLGIMLFGRDRVSPKMHFFATVMVAVGTLISAFWILSANSWMHTPVGFRIGPEGIFMPTDWLAIIFNPSFPYRFLHMMFAAYLTTAFAVGGCAAYYLLKNSFQAHARIMFFMSMLMAVFATPLQIMIGHSHGLNTLAYQPTKLAAIEAIWDTQAGAPLTLFGFPDRSAQKTHYAIKIPKGASFVLTGDPNATIKGLKSFPKSQWPSVANVFWFFRVMVGIGCLMLFTGICALYLYYKKTLFTNRMFHRFCVLMIPSGFLAVLAGWFTTEMGRQPYVVYGLLKTKDLASPVSGEAVLISLGLFVGVYLIIFGAGVWYIAQCVRKGPLQNRGLSPYV